MMEIINLSSVLIISVIFAHNVTALYSSKTAVRVANASEFENLKKNGDPMLVKFYSSGCPHCQSFVPEFEKAATALKGIVKVIAIEDKAAMGTESIGGFPTVKFIAGTVKNVYSGNRVATSIVDFTLEQLKSLTKSRLGGKSESKSEKKGGSADKDVIVLDDSNFEKTVVKEKTPSVWLVEFYAPWCGHCKSLEPTWNKVATELKDQVKVAKVDATVNQMLARHFGIQGFPTIYLIPSYGDRSWNSVTSIAVTYDGNRDEKSIADFARSYYKMSAKAVQLTSQSQLDERCNKGVCVLAFLPDILETGAAGRNNLLEVYNGMIRASYSLGVKFFWLQGGEQFDVEESLHLAFGFPAVVALNLEKSKYAVHKGTFTDESLRQFVTGLMSAKASVSDLPKNLPSFKTVEVWDGKDGMPPVEEEL